MRFCKRRNLLAYNIKIRARIIITLFIFLRFSDDRLSLAEFTLICRALFRNNKGHIYIIQPNHVEEMFAVFDKNQDGEDCVAVYVVTVC